MGPRSSAAWILAALLALYPSVCCCTLDLVLPAGSRTVAAPGGECCRAPLADGEPGAPSDAQDRHCPDRPCKCGKDRTTLASAGKAQTLEAAPGALLFVLPGPLDVALPGGATRLAPQRRTEPIPATSLLRLHCALLV